MMLNRTIFVFLIFVTTVGIVPVAHAIAGIDGSRSVSSVDTQLNRYAQVTGLTTNTITVANITTLNGGSDYTNNALSSGDLVLVYQAQGATFTDSSDSATYGAFDYANAGHFEFAEVLYVSGNTIYLCNTLTNSYTVPTGHVQVARVPQYTSLTVNTGASVVAAAWNGTVGGIVALNVSGTLTVNVNGQINVDSRGFRGGARNTAGANPGFTIYRSTDATQGAQKGESILGFATEYTAANGQYGRGAPANGGGGGNAHNASGGGGANGNNAGTWTGSGNPSLTTANWSCAWDLDDGTYNGSPGDVFQCANNPGRAVIPNYFLNGAGGGRGGYTYAANNQNALTTPPENTAWGGDYRRQVGGLGGRPLINNPVSSLFFGGGGGGGDNNNSTGTNGAPGGGLILIDAASLTGAGILSANGGTVETAANNDGSGGGGGGGTIVVRTTNSPSASLVLRAAGGAGGSQNLAGPESEGPGGGGGGGYIRLSTGTTFTIAPSVVGGANGTTNSSALTEFPPNGATQGYPGLYQAANFTFPGAQRCGLDFGDAPDPSYPTLLANNGPRHLFPSLVSGLRVSIGSLIDAETNGQPNATATLDDVTTSDDEDGVTFSTPAGGGDNIIAQISVVNTAGLSAQVCGWLDGGGASAAGTINGAFDSSEQQCTTVTTTTTVNFEWLVSSTTTQTYNARFRICAPTTITSCNSPTGLAINGEVEDYQITYNPTLATVGSFDVKSTRVDEVFSELTGQDGDTAALLALLASWDPELAASLKDADAATLVAALRRYLDPDGDGNVALVRWDTLQEHGTVGFYAERAQGDGWTRLNGGLLPGLIDAPQGGEYWLFDPEVTAGTYRYRLVELEAWGSERLHGPWDVQIGAAVSKMAQTAAPSTATEETTEATEFWSDWQGLAQGFAARKRVPPPPATPALMAKAATVATPTGALWLRTQAEGLYRVSTAQLATLLGEKEDQVRKWLSKDRKLALTNAGAPAPWYYDDANDALYFVAQTYHTLHTDENAYHVVKNNAQSLTMAERTGAGPVAGSSVGAFRDTLRLEQDLTYSLWSVTDDTEADYWFWDYLYAGTGHDAVTLPLTLPDAASTGQGQLRIYLRGWTDFEQGNDHRVSTALNGKALGAPLEWDGFTTAVLTVPFDQTSLKSSNSLKLLSEKINASVTKNPGQWLDRIEVDYWREPTAENGQLWLHGLAAGTHTVTGFTNDAIHVIEAPATAQAIWRRDVTIAPNGTGWQVSFNAPQGGDFLVAESAATPTVEIDATSTLAKANNRADYLIVAPRALAQTANALASYRDGRKNKVEIAWLDDIYDEFSAGRTDPSAISDFLAYVYGNWKRVPEYVVLLGNGTLDHKNRQGYGDSLLPVRMMMTPWGLAVSDHRYVDTDSDGQSEYAFGRIPVTTDAQGLAYVDKVRAATTAPTSAVVVADDTDGAGDFATNADLQAKELADLGLSVTKLYHPSAAVRAALTNSATWNVAYLSYDGHGSAKQLGTSSENFLTITTAKALTNRTLPVFVALTCAAGDGSLPGVGGSVAGALALNPQGGALAALAPTSASLDSDARVIGSAFADYLIGGDLSIGQAAREAQTHSASLVAPFMLGAYQILGDPAVQLP